VPSEGNRYNPGPEYRTMWATYDPDQANALLDGLGLTAKDGDGFRQRLDGGGRLRIEAVTISGQFMPFTQIAEVIAEDWRAIGIELIIREVERGLSDTMVAANEVQIYVWNNDGSENVFISPKAVVPTGPGDTMGPLYGAWYASSGAEGKEPPDHLKTALEKFDRAKVAPVEERLQLGKELWANAVDQVYAIGVVGLSAASMGIRLVKNYVGNNPARQYSSPATRNPGISCPPTFYYTE
jgi:peptide/nickel transport system substrate-binding protein